MSYKPKFPNEFDELCSFARNDVDLAQTMFRLFKEGLPVLVADVDNISADSAGNRVLPYKLPEELQILLSAARAKNLDARKGLDAHAAHYPD